MRHISATAPSHQILEFLNISGSPRVPKPWRVFPRNFPGPRKAPRRGKSAPKRPPRRPRIAARSI
eukprot:2843639-Pyramimonas_sp.AAC.1